MEANYFVFDQDFDFHSIKKLGPIIKNNFSNLLGLIWVYVKKSYNCIVATSKDP